MFCSCALRQRRFEWSLAIGDFDHLLSCRLYCLVAWKQRVGSLDQRWCGFVVKDCSGAILYKIEASCPETGSRSQIEVGSPPASSRFEVDTLPDIDGDGKVLLVLTTGCRQLKGTGCSGNRCRSFDLGG